MSKLVVFSETVYSSLLIRICLVALLFEAIHTITIKTMIANMLAPSTIDSVFRCLLTLLSLVSYSSISAACLSLSSATTPDWLLTAISGLLPFGITFKGVRSERSDIGKVSILKPSL